MGRVADPPKDFAEMMVKMDEIHDGLIKKRATSEPHPGVNKSWDIIISAGGTAGAVSGTVESREKVVAKVAEKSPGGVKSASSPV